MKRIPTARCATCDAVILALVLILELALPNAHAARPSLAGMKAEIDSLTARPGPVLVVANDVVIGTLVQPHSIEFLDPELFGCRYRTLSSKNYIFEVTYSCLKLPGQSSGQLAPQLLAYESVDCTGQAYLWYETGSKVEAENLSQGKVFAAADGMRYYVPMDSEAVVKFVRSLNSPAPWKTIPGCGGFANQFFIVQPAFVNDPDVTGVENTEFQAPVRLEQ